jgi:small subunit ribosomal protein S20
MNDYHFELEVYGLANIKSAKKRILVSETRAARNKSIRSEVKTSIKKVEAAVAAKDKAVAEAALKNAISTIESASSKGVYHKNNAGRKVSRLTKLVNTLA